MAHTMFSGEWARAWGERINANERYRDAAGSWEWPLVLSVQADPAFEIPEDRAVYLDLYRGECREAREATAADLDAAPFAIRSDAVTWKQVLDGKLEPIMGLMRGKLKLTKGSMATLARYVRAAKELVRSAQEVDTDFPAGLR